jgi:hypothetical protein
MQHQHDVSYALQNKQIKKNQLQGTLDSLEGSQFVKMIS